jgi:hypothetical protein
MIFLLGRKTRRIESFGHPTHRREDNIKMDFREIEWVVWTGFIWLRIETSSVFLRKR